MLWKRTRKAIRLVLTGLPPMRAVQVADIPAPLLENPKLARLVNRAEALYQLRTLSLVNGAASGQPIVEAMWQDADVSKGSKEATATGGPATGGQGGTATGSTPSASPRSHAPTRTRTWSKADWKAAAFLLERRFPAEWGQQAQAADSQTPAIMAALLQIAQGKQARLPAPRPAIEGSSRPASPPEGEPPGTS